MKQRWLILAAVAAATVLQMTSTRAARGQMVLASGELRIVGL